MHSVSLFVLILINIGGFLTIETKETFQSEDNILLKALPPARNEYENRSPTWSEMLASVLVNRVKNFSYSKREGADLPLSAKELPKIDPITKVLSNILEIYKVFVYDRWNNKKHSEEKNLYAFVTGDKKYNTDPKEEVEIIEPKYHGKLCRGCNEDSTMVDIAAVSDCPEGYIKDLKGTCVFSKISKFIVSVPHQCPVGYRRDRMGYCRAMF